MNRQPSSISRDAGPDRELAVLIERLTARLQAGEHIDEDELAAAHPDHAERLRQLLPALKLLADAAPSSGVRYGVGPPCDADASCAEPLGDFQLIREVGRGGMGIVYEAMQMSLNRRVALKVLPWAAAMDPRQLQRFKNEALAAGSLRHEHIVHVYGVGCERGVHFYAMEFIDGQTLAQVIGERGRVSAPSLETPELGALTRPRSPETTPIAALSTKRDKTHFRAIAALIADAADALEHAHSLGIVHRDVKPGNLLLDDNGKIYVSDFGLARMASPGCEDRGLTMSGDLLGTLRYMSPEQALARHGLVDHRTDVYSLGATLYELLTLQPAIRGEDKAEILKHIAFEEPTSLRKLDKSIPAEFETITLKCLAKEPSERYATAGELADDLRRWLEDKPIKAKRPTVFQRVSKWSRRHPGVTAGAALVVGLLIAGAWEWYRETTNADTAALAVAEESDQLRNADRLPEALQVARRAADLLPRFGGNANLGRAVQQRVADLQLLERLEAARLEQTELGEGSQAYNYERGGRLFRQAFDDYGVNVLDGDRSAVIEFLRNREIVSQISAAIFQWSLVNPNAAEKARLDALAAALDPDPRQIISQVCRAEAAKDAQSLVRLAAAVESDLPPRTVLVRLAVSLRGQRAYQEAERLLRAGQRRYPADFWINYELAYTLSTAGQAGTGEAIRFSSVALALRPQSPAANNMIGVFLKNQQRFDEAEAAYRRSIELDPNNFPAHTNLGNLLLQINRPADAVHALQRAADMMPNDAKVYGNLGNALARSGRPNDAETAYRRSISLDPTNALPHYNLGNLLLNAKRNMEAENSYREAIKVKPDFPEAHYSLGNILMTTNRANEAEQSYLRAIALKPDYSDPHTNLGNLFLNSNRPSDAITHFRRAVELLPKNAVAHANLGVGLRNLWRLKEAEEEFRRAIQLDPKRAESHNLLADLLMRLLNRPAEAIPLHRKAIELKPDDAVGHFNLGNSLRAVGQSEEAASAYRHAIERRPDYAMAHVNLGTVLVEQGHFSDALIAMRRGHELGSKQPSWRHPTEQWLRDFERFVALEPKLHAVLASNSIDAVAAERIVLAQMCYFQKHYSVAVRLYSDAFADSNLPKEMRSKRYDAACAGALASSGKGNDADKLGDSERTRLRQQALGWLNQEFADRSKLVDAPNGRPQLRQALQQWRQDPDLAGVRDSAALQRLPGAEREAWEKFWAEVDDLLKGTK